MGKLIHIIVLLIPLSCISQHKNEVWYFGDSAGINFSNLAIPIPIQSGVKSRGSCVTICDNSSNALFYSYTRAGFPGNTTLVKNVVDQVMPNGSNIVGEGWYLELLIIPFPSDTSKFYLFSIGVTSSYGLYYSIIDMTLDAGKGDVTLKNQQLLSLPANDGLTSVRHGNGRDWWLIFREYDGTPDNKFYKYLISPSGISGPYLQNIGTITNTNTLRYNFNSEGNKLSVVQYEGLCETFDFDRCTGVLSNHTLIRNNATIAPSPAFWSCEFSPNNRFLYISTSGDTSYLIQIDLLDTTPWLNADTLWNETNIKWAGGALKRAPDNKIYLSCAWNDNINWNFPYPDSVYNLINSNLSVINQPDSPGVACNFTPYSFYLGGARTYWGLPNNPNYDLPKLAGSICDSLQFTGSPPAPEGGVVPTLQSTYVATWQKLFVNAQNIKGRQRTLRIYSLEGKLVYQSISPPSGVGGLYFTQDVDVSNLSSGMYLITLITEKESLNAKFVKE